MHAAVLPHSARYSDAEVLAAAAELARIADIDRPSDVGRRVHDPDEAIDQVINIAE